MVVFGELHFIFITENYPKGLLRIEQQNISCTRNLILRGRGGGGYLSFILLTMFMTMNITMDTLFLLVLSIFRDLNSFEVLDLGL